MDPKKKAKELLKRMKSCMYSDGMYDAKLCALIAIEELIKQESDFHCGNPKEYYYWEEVKNELVKL